LRALGHASAPRRHTAMPRCARPLVSELLRLARISIAESRRRGQLPMRPDAMQDDRTSTHSINKQEVRSEMTLRESAPMRTTLAQAVLAEG